MQKSRIKRGGRHYRVILSFLPHQNKILMNFLTAKTTRKTRLKISMMKTHFYQLTEYSNSGGPIAS